ncbi:uncharacterized protein N7479_009311 [Penicillium vulpinum]|uniref:uncharacterized protein n=1 Tax=Penicillium vulpinum TaxID=29845 RepID=UPI002547B055|nr:uncharacterized protein N7479_009311 [Penicillium vulpinum]KAJ5950898.1 hypothetical protein N7479_009311 [Penicillium vulpinum]
MTDHDYMKQPPAYTLPKNGIVSHLPTSWIPYAQLMRLHKLTGFSILYCPCPVGVVYAAALSPRKLPASVLLHCVALLTASSFILRSVGCQVARCQQRPIARGAVTTTQGCLLATALLLIKWGLLFSLPLEALVNAGITMLLAGIYPFCKRFTNYPEVVLNLVLGWPIRMAPHSLRIRHTCDRCLFTAIAILNVINDMIYASQDVEDDIKVGIKSMAVRFRDSVKLTLSILSLGMVALLAGAGVSGDTGPMYFVLAVGGIFIRLSGIIASMDLKYPSICVNSASRVYVAVNCSMAYGLLWEYFEGYRGP